MPGYFCPRETPHRANPVPDADICPLHGEWRNQPGEIPDSALSICRGGGSGGKNIPIDTSASSNYPLFAELMKRLYETDRCSLPFSFAQLGMVVPAEAGFRRLVLLACLSFFPPAEFFQRSAPRSHGSTPLSTYYCRAWGERWCLQLPTRAILTSIRLLPIPAEIIKVWRAVPIDRHFQLW